MQAVYGRYPWVSSIMHFAGGIAIAFFFLSVLTDPAAGRTFGRISGLTVFLLTVSLTATTAVFWEFGEWTLDHWFAARTQLGLNDTLLDMLLGILGAAVVAILSRFRGKNR